MGSGSFRFDRFVLDSDNRRITDDGRPLELNSRYFDALALLVREQGQLVSKDRFLDEVWRGVPVTDEALTQCIRTLRRQLGDDAASPRFIETVPKHGYRFIASVGPAASETPASMSSAEPRSWRQALVTTAAGTVGGGVAGLFGGMFYGLAAAAQPLAPGTGATSVLLVLLAISILVGLIGGAGVSFGIAAAGFLTRPFGRWSIFGGAAGGLLVGAFVKLLGLDAFDLLFGRSPGNITGAVEGAILGGAVGVGAWLACRGAGALSARSAIASAAFNGAAAGMLIALIGGRLMGGSLDLLARTFAGSRIGLDQLGALFGESGFGRVTQIVTSGLEGALFAACIVGAMVTAERRFGRAS
jgi:DNA-binding winged helix-turn-helix (wHTH) protein